jgi:lipid-A-disaccharide synthase-like uncharacterized protein
LRLRTVSGKVNSRDSSTRGRAVRALSANEALMMTVENLWTVVNLWIVENLRTLENLSPEVKLWLAVGFLGQAAFFCRFFVQWIASERKKESVFPIAFWYFSIGGGSILLIYAIHRKDPVFIVGQGTGLFIYFRNLYLIWRKQRQLAQAGT